VRLTKYPTPLMKVGSLDALDPKSISLTIYLVNVQKLKVWDDASEFDAEKDKARFRQYEAACDRVKNFYKEQHGKGCA
jgi:inositol oxygenase